MDSSTVAASGPEQQRYTTLNPIIETDAATFALAHATTSSHITRESLNSEAICESIPPAPHDTNAFKLTGLLGASECQYVMNTAAPHMRAMDNQYAQKHRQASRAMLRSASVARELFSRMLPLLTDSDYVARTPLCFGHDGVWRPFALNECLKVFKYTKGGAFTEHQDGPWVPREDQCSMYTVVIYLNDVSEGGSTCLLGSGRTERFAPQGQRRGRHSGRGVNVVPTTGTALLFNHECWHAGWPVGDCEKWILRTELIFQRIHTFAVDKNRFSDDQLYLEAKALYQKSMTAMEEGRKEEFFDDYAKVVCLQRDAMLAVEQSKKSPMLQRLDYDTFAHVLSFLALSDFSRLLKINRRTFAAIVTSSFWQVKWEALFTLQQPSTSLKITNRLAGAFNYYAAVTSGGPIPPIQHNGGDYFVLYRQQLHRNKVCPFAALIIWDPSAVFLYRKNSFNPDYNKYPDSVRSAFTLPKVQPLLPMSIGISESWYGSWQYAYPFHMNTPRSEHLIVRGEGKEDFLREGRLIDPFSGKPEWPVLSALVDQAVSPQHTPLLIIAHPAWTRDSDRATEALEAAFGHLRVPAVAMCHPAVCLFVSTWQDGEVMDEIVEAETSTAVVMVTEQGVHSFIVQNLSLAITHELHFTVPKEPVPNIVHQYGYTESGLIPLPSTELIVDATIEHLKEVCDTKTKASASVVRVLFSVNAAIKKKMEGEMMSIVEPYAGRTTLVSDPVVALSHGAARLLKCPGLRDKCMFRY